MWILFFIMIHYSTAYSTAYIYIYIYIYISVNRILEEWRETQRQRHREREREGGRDRERGWTDRETERRGSYQVDCENQHFTYFLSCVLLSFCITHAFSISTCVSSETGSYHLLKFEFLPSKHLLFLSYFLFHSFGFKRGQRFSTFSVSISATLFISY